MIFSKLTLNSVLEDLVDKYSDQKAIVFEEEDISYNDLYDQVNILAENFYSIGIKKNEKVAVILPNCLEYLYIYFALFKLGAWIVPVSTRYEVEEIKRVLLNAEVSTVIYQDHYGVFNYDEIFNVELSDYLANVSNYIVRGESKWSPVLYLADLLTKNEKDNFSGDLSYADEDDVAILGYTSGTTGHPKGVMMTHKNLILTSYYSSINLNMQNEVAFSIAPLYAAQGFNAVLIYFVAGITMKWITNYNPNDVLKHLIKKNINLFHTQPTMWHLILAIPFFEHVTFSNLKKVVVSGSLCQPALAKRIENSTKCQLINAYGIIEATGLVTMTPMDAPEDIRINTVGRPINGFQIKIVDDNKCEVPRGKTGELVIKGYLMKGYYNNPEKTNEVIDKDGWLYTGDLACYYKNSDCISIVGRKKDMVIRGGFNVYPVDIEECLLSYEKVDDVAVVGRPDKILGEALVAFVIPKIGCNLTSGEIKAFCRGKIANYKIVDDVIFVSQFPILDSGKVKKNVLAEWATNDNIPPESKLLLGGGIVKGIGTNIIK